MAVYINWIILRNWPIGVINDLKIKDFKQDKGQINCVREFIKALKSNEESPIDFGDLIEVQRCLLDVLNTNWFYCFQNINQTWNVWFSIC